MIKMLITLLPVYLLLSGNSASQNMESGYAQVNGLKVYYEIHGSSLTDKHAVPLVLIHGGGSTIETTFGKILPLLSKNRMVIAVELQAHGRTPDIERPLTFKQDADDVASLLKQLKVAKADFFGFSNGGSTALQIGIRHPGIVNKLIIASAMYKRDGLYPWFWEFMNKASLENMPQNLKDAYLKVAPDPNDLQSMHDKDAKRMLEFKDWPDEDLNSITAPAMIIIGDKDVIRPEHALEMSRLLSNSKLVILPGGHGTYIGEVTMANENSRIHQATVLLIEEFLNEPVLKLAGEGSE